MKTEFQPPRLAVIFSAQGMEAARSSFKIIDHRLQHLHIAIALLLKETGEELCAAQAQFSVRGSRTLTLAAAQPFIEAKRA